MSTMLLDGLDGTSGEGEGKSFFKLGDVDALLLQIGVLPDHACGVEFGSTSLVGVTSTHLRTLA